MTRSDGAIIFAICLAAVPAFGTELSLKQTVEQALYRSPLFSPQLKNHEQLHSIASSDRWRRYLINEPQVQYARNDDATAEVVSLNETVGFPGKSIALSRLDAVRERAAWAELQARRYEIARDVIQAYLDAATSEELVKQQRRNIADLETLQRSLDARYQAGMATQAETLVNDLQLRQQKADLVGLEDRAATASRHLVRLLQLDADAVAGISLPDDIDVSLLSEIGDRTADEWRAEASQAAAIAAERTATWSQLPDINLSVSRNRYLNLQGSPNGRATTHSYGVGLSVPILSPLEERAEIQRQRAQARIDALAAKTQEITAAKDREDARREYVRSRARLKELREKDLPYAEALMESTFSAYKSGKLGMAELVLARKTLTDLRAQDVQLRASIISAHLRCLAATDAS